MTELQQQQQQLQNPALEFFLNDLRSTMSQQPDNQTRIQKILDNLQYIVSKKQNGSSSPNPALEAKNGLPSLNSPQPVMGERKAQQPDCDKQALAMLARKDE